MTHDTDRTVSNQRFEQAVHLRDERKDEGLREWYRVDRHAFYEIRENAFDGVPDGVTTRYKTIAQTAHREVADEICRSHNVLRRVSSVGGGEWTGKKCPSCKGSGVKPNCPTDSTSCPACGGTGDEYQERPTPGTGGEGEKPECSCESECSYQ